MKKELQREIEWRLETFGRQGGTGSVGWDAVIRQVAEEYRGTAKQRLLKLRYFEGWEDRAVMEALPVSRNVYQAWKKELLTAIALQAAYRRLVRP